MPVFPSAIPTQPKRGVSTFAAMAFKKSLSGSRSEQKASGESEEGEDRVIRLEWAFLYKE